MVTLFVIIVYDISSNQINRVRIFLKQYLNWVQNSVFEGELTKTEFRIIEKTIKETIDKEQDYVKIYTLRSDKYLEKSELGTSKVNLSSII